MRKAKWQETHETRGYDPWTKLVESHTTVKIRKEQEDPNFIAAVELYGRKQAFDLYAELHPDLNMRWTRQKDVTQFLTVHEEKKEASLSCHADTGNCSRHFIIDSGASFHLISREELSKKEAAQIRTMKKPIQLRSANGLTTATHDVELCLPGLGNEKVVVLVLEDTPSVLSLGKLCSENGYDHIWKKKTTTSHTFRKEA